MCNLCARILKQGHQISVAPLFSERSNLTIFCSDIKLGNLATKGENTEKHYIYYLVNVIQYHVKGVGYRPVCRKCRLTLGENVI